MLPTWLTSPLIALVRPAASAVAGDLWRRWRINRRFASRSPSEKSPIIEKAIADLDVLLGTNAQLTESVAHLLEDLKDTGLLELIARNAFYDIDDEGVRVYFEALFVRHTPNIDLGKRKAACRELFDIIQFMLRESLRIQIDPDLQFIFDSFIDPDSAVDGVPSAAKVRAAMAQIRPDIAKRVGLSGQTILAYKADNSGEASGLNQLQFPAWLYLTPAQLEQQVKFISEGLIQAYEFVRLDGPAQRSYDCEIDNLYVPARLTEADFSIRANILQERNDSEASYLHLIPASSQCIILGDPGGGKSTLAQRVCLDALRISAADGRSPLAIKVELRRFVRKSTSNAAENLVDFIASEIARQANIPKDARLSDVVQHLLFFGRMMVVFDGVDEIINTSKRRDAIASMQQLANRFLQDKFIYTCRRTDFLTTPITGVQVFILQQFNMDEVRAYYRSASKYVFEYSDAEIDNRENPFLRQAEEHASEFIKNPLLLALIVWIYNVGQRIPDNRIELYHECSELLFQRWDSLKDIDPELPDAHWLFQLVTEIAHRLYLINRAEEGDSNAEWLKARALEFFRRMFDGDVENRARAASERFVRHLIGRSWVLQERSAGTFEFTHRTFMEYYFARWLHDEFDGIKILFDNIQDRILAGEWTVPIHLAFQMKTAGKLKSAESLAGLLIGLIERARESERKWAEANAKRSSELGRTPRSYPQLDNVLRFVVTSIGYLQPSEPLMVRITKALASAVSTKAQWFAAIGSIVAAPTEFQAAIVEGVQQALADDIANKQGYAVGFVVDWLYACYLSKRPRHPVQFPTHVLRFEDVRERFGAKFLEQVKEGRGSASLPKMTFDLTGVTLPVVTEVGLAMWAASILPDKRLDWRFVDFGLGLVESIDILLGNAEPVDCPYVGLFAHVAVALPQQRGYQIAGGPGIAPSFDGYQISGSVGVLPFFDCTGLEIVAGKLANCPANVSASFAISLMGYTELTDRLGIAPTSPTDKNATKKAKELGGLLGPRKDIAYALLTEVSSRADMPAELRSYIDDWKAGRQRMFAPTTRTEYVDHKQAFAGLKEDVE
jgi:hypothetical protein